jgi:hypothetical protein
MEVAHATLRLMLTLFFFILLLLSVQVFLMPSDTSAATAGGGWALLLPEEEERWNPMAVAIHDEWDVFFFPAPLLIVCFLPWLILAALVASIGAQGMIYVLICVSLASCLTTLSSFLELCCGGKRSCRN